MTTSSTNEESTVDKKRVTEWARPLLPVPQQDLLFRMVRRHDPTVRHGGQVFRARELTICVVRR